MRILYKCFYPITGCTMYRDELGRAHREDGPAAILADGRTYWYLHGKDYPNHPNGFK